MKYVNKWGLKKWASYSITDIDIIFGNLSSEMYVLNLNFILWCVFFMLWRSWARLVNSWARVVCVLIMSCVAERAHVQMCRETRLDIVGIT